MPQHIVVTEYHSEWVSMFEEEARLIKSILRENCMAVYHIGSTAVPGLKAKPVIDMMPVVHELQKVDDLMEEFVKSGYEYMGEFGIAGRRYLRKGGDERTHQVNIFEKTNKTQIDRHLAVRDFLRMHREIAEEYGALKEELAGMFPYDIEGYCDGKEEFMKTLERKALEWKDGQTGKRQFV